MKKQTGFISSSSSVTITYSTSHGTTFRGYSDIYNVTRAVDITTWEGDTYSNYSILSKSTNNAELLWKTYSSSSYQRIEYFLEAVEKLNTAYHKTTKVYYSMLNYAPFIDKRSIYKGFVDLVITFPCVIRLAGIELINPWNDHLAIDDAANWKYLPSKFSIYKVNTEKINENLVNVSYETDVMKTSEYSYQDGQEEVFYPRPIKYDSLNFDKNLTFLGTYDVNWETISSYKCFFKFNEGDKASLNVDYSSSNAGTATWECKQLVLRIFDTKMSAEPITDVEVLKQRISEYIADKEAEFGTTYADGVPTAENVLADFDKFVCTNDADPLSAYIISNKKNYDSSNSFNTNWRFGSSAQRNYSNMSNLYFASGIDYKIGGIQLLLSPDIFSISEMKMYNYSNSMNNKVFIGEWNKDDQALEYYGAGTVKTSEYIDISNLTENAISWRHNFNIPPKYLDCQVYARFNVDFGTFYAGDVVTNLVNTNKEPLSMRLTGTDVTLNISNGICFTNPETGEFLQFKDGVGMQLDRPGKFDALQAAIAVDAPVLEAQSLVAAKIEALDSSRGGAYPFDIYFVVKRLF